MKRMELNRCILSALALVVVIVALSGCSSTKPAAPKVSAQYINEGASLVLHDEAGRTEYITVTPENEALCQALFQILSAP
jgi:predicted component of type VI protein secretion system